jgi:hypothetical protein
MAATSTILPVIEAFMAAHRLTDVTIVAHADMISAANQRAIEAAGCRYPRGAHPRRAVSGRGVAP